MALMGWCRLLEGLASPVAGRCEAALVVPGANRCDSAGRESIIFGIHRMLCCADGARLQRTRAASEGGVGRGCWVMP